MGHLQATETSEGDKGSDKAPEQRFEAPRLEISNQDMLDARHLFPSGKSTASEQPPSLDFGSPASLYGADALGLSDRVLIAQATDRQPAMVNENQTDLPAGSDIAKHAQALGEFHPGWWRNEGKEGEIRKCNTFVDRVFRDMDVPLPWDARHIPTVHGMHQALSQSKDWEQVYSDKQPLSGYHPQPGDLALWDKTIVAPNYDGSTYRHPLQHSGVLGAQGEIMYAGSGVTHGYAESDFKAMCAAKTYGPPSVIYRSTHLEH